jgi:hypothetical protein
LIGRAFPGAAADDKVAHRLLLHANGWHGAVLCREGGHHHGRWSRASLVLKATMTRTEGDEHLT